MPLVVLASAWAVTVAAIVVMLVWQDVRHSQQYGTARYVLHACYASALVWYLARTGPPMRELPELGPTFLPRWKFGVWIPVAGAALLFVLTLADDRGVGVLTLLMAIATAWMLLAWRREVRLRAVLQGLALALVAFGAGWPLVNAGFVAESSFYVLLAFVAPMYVVGGRLCSRTGVGGLRLGEGRYVGALRSFLWGSLLFVPMGLINAAEGSPGPGFPDVAEWWTPLTLPWFSGIVEEAWFRLLLVGLCVYLLRPAFGRYPLLTIIAAALFSGLTFGISHGRTLERLLVTGLLYGVPMAFVFARRDWEHSVGAHYMINMIPTVTLYLEGLSGP